MNKPNGYPEKYPENILLLLKWRQKFHNDFLEDEKKSETHECPNF
jgi:hypothetical protein